MEHLSLSATLKQRLGPLYGSRTLQTVLGLAGSNFLSTAIGLIGSLIQARFVTPEDLGYFRGFSIATGYAFFFHFGLFGALQRLYPFYVGKGERSRALALAQVCQAWNLSVSILLGGVFMALAAVSLYQGNWRAMLGWLVQVVGISGFIYGGYLSATYRSGHDFSTVAKGGVLSSITSLFTLPFFIWWPYVALALRSSVGNLVSLVYLHIRRPLRLGWRFTWSEWYGLLKEGGPIFIASYGYTTGWSVVETSLILHFLDTGALGLWSMSFLLSEGSNKLAQAITAVYTPRITEWWGKTESIRECLELMRKPLRWGVPGMLAMAAVIAACLPFVVPLLAPKYTAAVSTMSLMLLLLPLYVLELPFSLLVAMGRVIQQNVVTYVGLLSFALLAVASVFLGYGLNGIVVASLIGRAIRLLGTFGYIAIARREK